MGWGNRSTFHFFRKKFIDLLQQDCVEWGIDLRKIFYVSDGAASQYKNYKNYANLVKHVEDFELEAEWHLTATAHGKSTCDALTAVAKRGARLESLKPNRQVVSALDFFDFCHGKLTTPTL
jgi:hypothetical protein